MQDLESCVVCRVALYCLGCGVPQLYTERVFKGCFSSKQGCVIFKPPPPVGAGGGYMFSGRPSVHPSVIHVVVLCFRDISTSDLSLS